MQLAIIAPIEYLKDLCPLGGMELCFAHMMIEGSPYCEYYTSAAARGRSIILDNGIMELGSAIGTRELLKTAKKLQPTFLTPPEFLHDAEATIRATENFLISFEKSGLYPKTQLLTACHGNSLKSWLSCYQRLAQLPFVGRIGIPYDIQFDTPCDESSRIINKWLLLSERRLNLCQILETEGIERDVHLFGLAHVRELLHQAKHHFVKSNDSSLSVMSALNGHLFSENNFGSEEKPFIDWDFKSQPILTENARHNIRFLLDKLS